MKRAHLIGIGGAGVSAIAKYLTSQGYAVQGSDDTYSETIKTLEKEYDVTYTGKQSADSIDADIDLVVYTPAVGPGNPEYERAQLLEIRMLSYPEYLGVIAHGKKTIAIAGTNGKTTTTTMIAEVLVAADFDPTVIVGAEALAFNSNYRAGESDLFVVEACEYKHSFLSLGPDVLVITNITPDHLDFFKTVEQYVQAFVSLIKNMKPGSILVYNGSDELTAAVLSVAEAQELVLVDYQQMSKPELEIAGTHNILNAQAALAAVSSLKGNVSEAHQYLESSFKGSKRRLEKKGITKYGDIVYDDYAHNPEGLALLIDGLERRFTDKNIVVYFQPHLFSRTKDFLHEFASALAVAHRVILLPIYHAREEDPGDISSKILAETVALIDETLTPDVVSSFDEAVELYESLDRNKEHIIVTVGAGDVYKIGERILHAYGA